MRHSAARIGEKPRQVIRFRVPTDDTTTTTYWIDFYPDRDGQQIEPRLKTRGFKKNTPGVYKRVQDEWWGIDTHEQDRVAQESQGLIADRTTEHLASSDRGIIMMRKMVRDSIDAVRQGKDPIGVIRDRGKLLLALSQLNYTVSNAREGFFMIRVIPIIVALLELLTFDAPTTIAAAAESLEQLVAAGKREGEVTLISSASTFGGKKGFSDLEAAFNKKYGLRVKVNLSPGPNMPQVASRVLTELKAGIKSSTDLYLGSDSTFAALHKENALQKIPWSGIFPWVTKEMEITPQESLLVYASFHGIIYNSNSIPKDKAPKNYEDLIDPALSPTWAGKLAIPAYTHWLVRVSSMWGKEKVLAYAKKLATLAGGRLRQGEEERIVSGEFPIMASTGGALESMWKWQAKGAPLVGLPGSMPPTSSYYQLGVPKNSAHPNLAKLFVAFMVSKEGQAIVEKHDYRSSYLVEGTGMSKYVRSNKLKLQDPKELVELFLKDDWALEEELNKILLR